MMSATLVINSRTYQRKIRAGRRVVDCAKRNLLI